MPDAHRNVLTPSDVNSVVAYLTDSWALFISTMILGALVGSFLNVVIARLPAGANLAWPPSHCPQCTSPIRPLHNVPIVSWLWLRGRCATCSQPISIRYPVVELITAFLFGACTSRFGPTPALLSSLAFTAALVAITFIDIDIWEIPDQIVVWGLPVVLFLRPWAFSVSWWSGCLGALAGIAILLLIRWVFFALRGIEAMGLGDVKLMAFIGGFLGIGAVLPVLTLSSVAGAFVGAILHLAHRPSDGTKDTSPPQNPDAPEEFNEPWAQPPKRLRLGAIIRIWGKRYAIGLPPDMRGRTHLRVGALLGARSAAGRSGIELSIGLYQDIRGWGHFEGWVLGGPPRFWIGPVVGARLPDVEAYGDDDDWIPPPTALPFGPFLALGALATMYFAPLLSASFPGLAL